MTVKTITLDGSLQVVTFPGSQAAYWIVKNFSSDYIIVKFDADAEEGIRINSDMGQRCSNVAFSKEGTIPLITDSIYITGEGEGMVEVQQIGR